MYYNSDDQQQFIKGERAALRASALYARLAWSRAEANAQRHALENDEGAELHSHAMRERFRMAHREATDLESDLAEDAEDDEYGDLDEYGYAA